MEGDLLHKLQLKEMLLTKNIKRDVSQNVHAALFIITTVTGEYQTPESTKKHHKSTCVLCLMKSLYEERTKFKILFSENFHHSSQISFTPDQTKYH